MTMHHLTWTPTAPLGHALSLSWLEQRGQAAKPWIWGFMVMVALLDVAFTWQCQSTMSEWESNPVARWALHKAGSEATILYRVLCLAFAGIMSETRTRLSWLITPVWGFGHLYLLIILAQSYVYLPLLKA